MSARRTPAVRTGGRPRTTRPPPRDLAAALEAARLARANAHAPYSNYRVGAAVLTNAGGVYAGCNVENATFGATLCAERSAVAAMIAAGERHPICCVVVTGGPRPGAPCGICRQVLAEFALDMHIELVAEDAAGRVVRRTSARLALLLPHAFRLTRSGAFRRCPGGARDPAVGNRRPT